ncbi:hypothetical protein PCE1_001052 [Barthelona sp. PCE]
MSESKQREIAAAFRQLVGQGLDAEGTDDARAVQVYKEALSMISPYISSGNDWYNQREYSRLTRTIRNVQNRLEILGTTTGNALDTPAPSVARSTTPEEGSRSRQNHEREAINNVRGMTNMYNSFNNKEEDEEDVPSYMRSTTRSRHHESRHSSSNNSNRRSTERSSRSSTTNSRSSRNNSNRNARNNRSGRETVSHQPPAPEEGSAYANAVKRLEQLRAGKVPKEFSHVNKDTIQQILANVIDRDQGVDFDSIAGLSEVKRLLREMIILPMKRPELFTGLRSAPSGLLLFGPPGNGKTMLAKAIASEIDCVFFSVSASALTSKFLGEGEKQISALFNLARFLAPSVIFLDEIDSLLGKRGEKEHDAMRRMKTEFLVQLDGVRGDEQTAPCLFIACTNIPWTLDSALLRRTQRRVYVPLPDIEARRFLVEKILDDVPYDISDREFDQIAQRIEGYSGADIKSLAQEVAFLPVRELSASQLETISANEIRPVNKNDWFEAVERIRPSAMQEELEQLEEFNANYGSS